MRNHTTHRRTAFIAVASFNLALVCVSCSSFNRYDAGGDVAIDSVQAFDGAVDALADASPIATCTPCDSGASCSVCSANYSCMSTGQCCTSSLANVGVADFTLTFDVTTSATQVSTIASQRASCDASSQYWDMYMLAAGNIEMEIGGDGAAPRAVTSTRSINDSAMHHIIVARRSDVLTISIDGSVSGTGPFSSLIGSLPALIVASLNPCETAGGRMPLAGTISNFCVQGF